MKNQKSLVLIVAAVMLLSFAAVPPAHAFVGIAALTVIIATTFASAVVVDKAVVKQKKEPVPEHSTSKMKTQHKIEASNGP
jgi:flagellar biosynthesis component FlhA